MCEIASTGGRYLEPRPLGDARFLVDFNLAYNPYCDYNEQWSCPLTPFENRLAVPIRAGEKLFAPKELDAANKAASRSQFEQATLPLRRECLGNQCPSTRLWLSHIHNDR